MVPPNVIQLLTLQYRVEKAALNSFILNIEWMATYWVQVQCCTLQERRDTVG